MNVLSEVPTYEQIKDRHPDLEALIFDMDGTLLDTERVHAASLFQMVEKFENSGRQTSVEEIEEKYKGLADLSVYQIMMEEGEIPHGLTSQDFISEKNRILVEESPSLSRSDVFNESILEMIKKAKADNMKVTLCTASERDVTHAMLKSLRLYDFFDVVKTNNDFENSKPHPEPYLKSMDEIGVCKSKVVIFEDSPTGLTSARSSGAHVYQVKWYL